MNNNLKNNFVIRAGMTMFTMEYRCMTMFTEQYCCRPIQDLIFHFIGHYRPLCWLLNLDSFSQMGITSGEQYRRLKIVNIYEVKWLEK